ncbi:GNAT family N-acetyltransferase [Desulfobacter sp.]|uniref:GNAT family N-acetyltransferase n=1 Tax=Desulfobacter sp. TaxID=2294 RepID=UPI003D10EA2B
MRFHLTIKAATVSDKAAWDSYVLSHPNGIAYQLFAWKESIEKAYKFKACYLMARDNRRVKGVLPLIIFKLPFSKKKLISLPYCDAGGPLADDTLIERALFQKSLEIVQSAKVSIRSSRPFADIPSETTINQQKARMLLNLPDASDLLLAGLKAKVRSQVKKAYKNGLTSTLGSLNLLPDFYSVFSENMRDLGSPVHSRKWIHAILKYYGNRAHVAVVYTPSGEPAAAGIILCHPRIVSIPWASSLRRFNKLNPNMMLYWTFLKFAADNGYPAFDFGRSTPDEGTFRFKRQWDARPEYLHWADFKQGRQLTFSGSSVSGNRRLAESFIMHLPVGAATALGTAARKYIPL